VVRTLERCLIDYKYGFTTSHDGDKKQIILGSNCSICGNYFEDNVEEDIGKLAPMWCIPCADKKSKEKVVQA